MSNSSFVKQINSIRQIIPAYYLPPIFFLGIIGNSLNIIVFAQSRLRTNVSSWYFICLSITQIGLLLCHCLYRIISNGWSYGYDIATTISALCKFRVYLTVLFIVLSRHFLCLITIDRWMKTSRSAWLREKSSPKYAKWFISLSFISWTVFSIHALIGAQSVSNSCLVALSGSTYELFYAIYNSTVGIVPFIIMIIFCFLLLKMIQKYRLNIIQMPAITTPVFNQQVQRQSRTDFQLVRLSLIQSFFYLIFNSILLGYPVYSFISSSWVKSIEQRAIDGLVFDISLYLLHTYISLTFILYTLASSTFHKETKKYLFVIKNIFIQIFQN